MNTTWSPADRRRFTPGLLPILFGGEPPLALGAGVPQTHRSTLGEHVWARAWGLFAGMPSLTATKRQPGKRRLARYPQGANNPGTARWRLDWLLPPAQRAVRELLRAYVDARLTTGQLLPDPDAARWKLDHSLQLQRQVGEQAATVCVSPEC